MKYLSFLFFTYLFALPIFGQQNSSEGKNIAVFFTEEYKTPWEKLPLIKEEVATIRAILEQKYHFRTEEYKNEDAKGIEQRIEELRSRKYAEDAQLFLFFSGHGHRRETGRNVEGFFVPYNATQEITTLLSYRLLRPRINEIPCKHILVMIDACESGTFSDEVAYREPPEWESKNEIQSQWIKEQLKDTTRYFASSVVKGRSPAKSDFAAKLIDALSESPKDGLLSISGLKSYLEKAIPAPYLSGFGDHKGGNFLFMTTLLLPPPPPVPLDTDKDGVPDIVDACPTEIGVDCASGCPDKDGDCITEKFGKDKCPDEKGEFVFDGCPDSDKDGVPDYKDKCKNEYAETENGCPTANLISKDKSSHSAPKIDSLKSNIPNNMVFIKGGTFIMGSKNGREGEIRTHQVSLNDFYLGKYEVSVEEFKKFIDAEHYKTDAEREDSSKVINRNTGITEKKMSINWRHDEEGNLRPLSEYNHPVIHVSHNDAVAYCAWLNKTSTDLQNKKYGLPTEAQWEYAARSGGKDNKYAWGNDSLPTNGANGLDASTKPIYGWSTTYNYTDDYVYSCPVEKSGANGIGLYGMSGNVWEWCNDWYDGYLEVPVSNPSGPSSSSSNTRVLRGGAWNNDILDLRCTHRFGYLPNYHMNRLGFRVALNSIN